MAWVRLRLAELRATRNTRMASTFPSLVLADPVASPMAMYWIGDGVDHRGTVGKVAPGIFTQEGRCWCMVYENPVSHGGHCMEPVMWVGRWKFLKGWIKVWSCDLHADELVGARALLR